MAAPRPSSRNSDARSGFTYAEMIREAITSSGSGQMFLYQIYDYLQTHFGCFRNAVDQNWKNSVRHSLSINPLFKRVEPVGGAGVTCTGSKRKATAGLWTMRNPVDIAKPAAPGKRKADDDWIVSPPTRSNPMELTDSSGGSATSSPIMLSSGVSSGSASPVGKYAMEDRDVAELLMALASGQYPPSSAGTSVPCTPCPTPAATATAVAPGPVAVFGVSVR